MLSLIVTLPFLSALLMGLVYLSDTHKSRKLFYNTFGIGVPLFITILAFISFSQLLETHETIHSKLFTWLSLGDFTIEVAFMADKLSMLMISFITFIGLLIHIYAAGYMKDEAGYGKFFAYFNLFMGSMLLLILADNPIMMFVGWELVGLSSYLLIGFYHQDGANIKAANKAFMLNRVGDFGFIIALSILFISLEGHGFTFDAIAANIGLINHQVLALIGILLFVGAMGKSAQVPLYVWLPDAMAGPTPVSALIHAATMVTAGVYMVARFSFIYEQIPNVGLFIAYIGAFSSLFAAIIASFQSDIKKILAYSTMSQLGYMFIAVGLGAYSSGIFHVFTHAFFKALLFMGAGAVIIAMHHEQNIFKMGGLKKHLKLIYATMLVGTLAISGIPPFAGFFSKDAIIMSAFANENYLIWASATLTAGLTAFYMFRLFFTVFLAPAKEERELHSVSKSMTYPLVLLAIGSTFAGFLGLGEAYGGHNLFGEFLALPDRLHHLSHTSEYILGGLNVFLALIGIALAYKLFGKTPQETQERSFLRRIVLNKFYIDEFYELLIVKPLLTLSRFTANIVDPKLFDGVISLFISSYLILARYFARLQNGNVRTYALYIVSGVSLMSLYLIYKLEGLL